MKLFYECNFFEEEFQEKEVFTVEQNELLLKEQVSQEKFSFDKLKVKYSCFWRKQSDWETSRPTVLIPIKDHPELIAKTIRNLKEKNVTNHCNVIIIDDRSTEDIESIVTRNGLSYLRVDNEKGFNFSMLNNIAAKICDSLGIKTIILWNSDLWCVEEEWLVALLDTHEEQSNMLTGTKLVYPPLEESLHNKQDTENIEDFFPEMKNGRWRNTVQFGGPAWIDTSNVSFIHFSPIHYGRFKEIHHSYVDCNRGVSFITGAFHIWNLKKYISLGGLNPTMATLFQDVDICLKLLENGDVPYYYGKNLYFYHDESYSLSSGKKKNSLQQVTDHVIFSKIWDKKVKQLVF